MDQIKIGKFIADIRKEKGMTQNELAQKLGVTDRAISKWENGRGMPDISIIQSLCEELSVSINELLSGERITDDDIKAKAEENILNSLKATFKNIRYKNIFMFIVVILVCLSLLLCCCYITDINRMRQNKPVVFSTWGFDYAPPIDLRDDLINLAVKEYVITARENEKKYENEKTFAAIKTYLIEETEKGKYFLYTWVLCKNVYSDEGELIEDSAYSMPVRFYIEKQGEEYVVLKEEYPRDGYYKEDIKELFPSYVAEQIESFHTSGDYERLEMEIHEQIKLYFHV